MIKNIRRVTGGMGGEVLLILGSEKTAIYDGGMAYCATNLVENIKTELDGRNLDYILLSHTHYDHIGGVPYLRKQWPGIITLGADHGKKVLEKPGALRTIRGLAINAAEKYSGTGKLNPDYKDSDLKIDCVIGDGDRVSLGNGNIEVYETKGHTRCSLSFLLKEDSILLASESTGVYVGNGVVIPSILTGYRDAIESIEKCRRLNAEHIFSPHYLLVEKETSIRYWDICKSAAEEFKNLTLGMHNEGHTVEEIAKAQKKRWWLPYCRKEQPLSAFEINTIAGIKAILREFNKTCANGC